ncbi:MULTISPECIES: MFS transporter [Pseudonocardia]|uniref:MFS-type drug efflux transporter P55 n=1 Tax=Pseudonocardia autotrophica TaxID=2074 RepID=A0A1Y2N3Y0_PSEAH|nr:MULTISPECIES: MFS transporter [Pseudonocardia]OSY41839.1 MFS-type drug efflux transporter P55 [Pseudonocardia autotrophica]TDN71109.1 putative MFS family arabinose efflux permease [Pseudonocardia autotrophica]
MTTPSADAVADGPRRLRLLQLAALTSTCDRFAIAPLLVPIAMSFGVPLAATAGAAGGYFLAYGLMQVVWGVLSDRIGRVRVMRIALIGAVLGGLASVLAPTLPVLIGARTLTGACTAALIPATLVYVGDSWPAAVRQRPLSDLLAATAVGTALATAGAGLLADLAGWRAVFATTAAAAGILLVALRALPEPVPAEPAAGATAPDGPRRWWSILRPVGTVLGTGWARVVLALAFVEGAVVLGVLTYLAPALQAGGSTAALAGIAAGGYGVGALVFSRVVRRLVGRVPAPGLAGIGGVFLAAAWIGPIVVVHPVTIALAGLLLGGSWAFLHSTLQTWATDVVPQARATAVALFATALFLGSSAGTALGAPLADTGRFPALFLAALVVSVPLGIGAALARARYARRRPPGTQT